MQTAIGAPRVKRPALLGALAFFSAAAVIAASLSLVGLADALTPPHGKSATVADKSVLDS